jgi:hypothetical protein
VAYTREHQLTAYSLKSALLAILIAVLGATTAVAQMPAEAPLSGGVCPIIPCYWPSCEQCDVNCYTCDEIESTCGYDCDEAIQKLEGDCGEICVPFTPTPTNTPTATPTLTPTQTPTPTPPTPGCLKLDGSTVRVMMQEVKARGIYQGDVLTHIDHPGCDSDPRFFNPLLCGGQYRRDSSTVNKLCEYAFEYRGTPCSGTVTHLGPFGGKTSFSSPGDNSCGYWNGSEFILMNATPCQGNMWFGGTPVTCFCDGVGLESPVSCQKTP